MQKEETMEYKRYGEYLSVSYMSVIQAFVVGLLVGAAIYAAAFGLDKYALQPLFCQPADMTYCNSTQTFSVVMSSIVMHFLGLLALVRANVLRPLLVVLASAIALIGFHAWFPGLSWWFASLLSGVLMALAYVYFAWINRMAAFAVALGLTVLSVVIIRVIVSL